MRVTDVSQVKPGDEVTVTFKGAVIRKPGINGSLAISVDRVLAGTGTGTHYVYPASRAYTIEMAEPEYVNGGVYVDDVGNVWQFGLDGTWTRPGTRTVFRFDDPARPLTRLLPEGRSDESR